MIVMEEEKRNIEELLMKVFERDVQDNKTPLSKTTRKLAVMSMKLNKVETQVKKMENLTHEVNTKLNFLLNMERTMLLGNNHNHTENTNLTLKKMNEQFNNKELSDIEKIVNDAVKKKDGLLNKQGSRCISIKTLTQHIETKADAIQNGINQAVFREKVVFDSLNLFEKMLIQ